MKISGGSGKEEVLFACCHGDGPRLPTGPSARQSPCGLSIPTVSGHGLTGSRASSLSFCQLSPNPVATTAKSQGGQGFRKGERYRAEWVASDPIVLHSSSATNWLFDFENVISLKPWYSALICICAAEASTLLSSVKYRQTGQGGCKRTRTSPRESTSIGT